MVGTREGGKKAALTNMRKYGNEFYRENGRKVGRNGHTGGFYAMSPEKRRECGAKGGRISRRGPAKKIVVE